MKILTPALNKKNRSFRLNSSTLKSIKNNTHQTKQQNNSFNEENFILLQISTNLNISNQPSQSSISKRLLFSVNLEINHLIVNLVQDVALQN